MEDLHTNSYRILTDAAIKALKEHGWDVRPAPGLGKANVRIITKDGEEARVSIRTSRDRWFAFQPQNNGRSWKTLDVVDYVCVASYDDKASPAFICVDLFDADSVRERFQQAYQARHQAGATPGDGFGMWVALDDHNSDDPLFVGGGLASLESRLAKYAINGDEIPPPPLAKASVSHIMETARHQVATLMGLPVESVNLEIHIKP